LSDAALYGKAERWVHGFCYNVTELEHLKRYEFASKYVSGKVVLDIASGCGFGARYLFDNGNAKFVYGVDMSYEAVLYSEIRYANENVCFHVGDASKFNSERIHDVIVSFETVEHLFDIRGFFNSLSQALSSEGTLIISTPIVNKTNTAPSNIYHVVEWCFDDFKAFYDHDFEISEVYLQSHKLLNKKYGIFHSLVWRICNLLKIKPKGLATRFIQHGFELVQVDPGFDFSAVHSGYMILVLKKINISNR
jgi:SAM-dependent methyltransferase